MRNGERPQSRAGKGKQKERQVELPQDWWLNLSAWVRLNHKNKSIFEVTQISPNTFRAARERGSMPERTFSRLADKFKDHKNLLRVLMGQRLIKGMPIPETLLLKCPKETALQGADFRVYPIEAPRPWAIRCHVTTESPYFRFGFKLLGEDGRIFGDGVIPSRDDNLVVHIGRNDYDRPRIGITARDIFLTAYDRGIAVEANDRFLFTCGGRVEASVELTVDQGGDFATLVVNSRPVFRRQVAPEICNRVSIYAWADREECQVEVSDLTIQSIPL